MSNNGCPIKAFGHDLSLCFAEVEDNLLSMPNTIVIRYKRFDINMIKNDWPPNEEATEKRLMNFEAGLFYGKTILGKTI